MEAFALSYYDEAKMAITSPKNLSDTLKAHRLNVLAADQQAASLERTPSRPTDPPYPIPVLDGCPDCGSDLDEYERCTGCSFNHEDCEIQECFICFEVAAGRAEAAYEGDR